MWFWSPHDDWSLPVHGRPQVSGYWNAEVEPEMLLAQKQAFPRCRPAKALPALVHAETQTAGVIAVDMFEAAAVKALEPGVKQPTKVVATPLLSGAMTAAVSIEIAYAYVIEYS
jgi:hypothetical protein